MGGWKAGWGVLLQAHAVRDVVCAVTPEIGARRTYARSRPKRDMTSFGDGLSGNERGPCADRRTRRDFDHVAGAAQRDETDVSGATLGRCARVRVFVSVMFVPGCA